MPAEQIHVVFDCDPGIDDALALGLLTDRVRSGRAVLDAVVAVGGNVGLDRTSANAAFLVGRLGLAGVPVWAGAARPLRGAAPGDAAAVHGSDGLGGCWEPPDGGAPAPQIADMGVVERLAAGLERLAPVGHRVLLATGPLTNLAGLIAAGVDLADRFDEIVVMGGAFGDPGGNVTPHAEFNIWVDPEAAELVVGAGLPVTLVPLDVTERVRLDRDDVAALEVRAGGPTLMTRLVSSGIDLYELLKADPFCEMHDPLAAAVVFDRDLVAVEPRVLRVEADGIERGRMVADAVPDRSPIEVALQVDVDRARGILLDALGAVTDR